MRTLIENKANVNAIDDDGKTSLHHASEGGKSRAIPILLQKGADIGIREKTTNKTALDMAANDRIRDLIIVYSAVPFNVKSDDLRWMDQAVKGEKPSLNPLKTMKKEDKLPAINNIPPQQDYRDRMVIAPFLRDKLMDLLQKIQEYGIETNQFIKKPYMFTGSWLEGVNGIQELYEKLVNVAPLETAIRVFNVFFPSEKQYPVLKGEEPLLSNFYGDIWKFSSDNDKKTQNLPFFQGDSALPPIEDHPEFKKMCALAESHQKKFEDKNDENLKLADENAFLKQQVAELTTKMNNGQYQKTIAELNIKIKQYTDQITKINADGKLANRNSSEKEMIIMKLQGQIDEQNSGSEELEHALTQVQDLESQLNEEKDKSKALRYKAGQLFIQALDKEQKGSKTISDMEHNLKDDDAIVKLFQALKSNPTPSLAERLKKLDKDGDNKLTKSEFTRVFAELNLSVFEMNALLRVIGFYNGKDLVGINEFIQILMDRPKKREKAEQKLFRALVNAFKKKGYTFNNAFTLLDKNGDGSIDRDELQEGFKALEIQVTPGDILGIMHILDNDKSNSISLEELQQKMEEIANNPEESDSEIDLGAGKAGDFELFNMEASQSLKLSKRFTKDDFDSKINPEVNYLSGELKIQVKLSIMSIINFIRFQA